jgi:hypothetical protein
VYMVMNLQVAKRVGSFLTNQVTVGFSRTVLHRVYFFLYNLPFITAVFTLCFTFESFQHIVYSIIMVIQRNAYLMKLSFEMEYSEMSI